MALPAWRRSNLRHYYKNYFRKEVIFGWENDGNFEWAGSPGLNLQELKLDDYGAAQTLLLFATWSVVAIES